MSEVTFSITEDGYSRGGEETRASELLCPLQVHHSSRLPLFTSLETSQTRSFWVLWRLRYIGMIDKITAIGNWLNHQFLSPSWRSRRWKWKFPLIRRLTLPASSFHPLVLSKSHLINLTNDTSFSLLTKENSKGFKSSVPEMEVKAKYIVLIINHSIIDSNSACSTKRVLAPFLKCV